MSSKFWFPSLPVSEVVDAFTGWGYSVSPEQVARPTSDFVLGVYSACLEQLTGITLETLQEPIEQGLTTTETPVRYLRLTKLARTAGLILGLGHVLASTRPQPLAIPHVRTDQY